MTEPDGRNRIELNAVDTELNQLAISIFNLEVFNSFLPLPDNAAIIVELSHCSAILQTLLH